MSLAELIPILQIAVGPVILISGVGLLLLSMTNRFGRVIDRTRTLTHEMREGSEKGQSVTSQLQILLRRAHLLRTAITLSALSVLLAAVLIITLFISAIFHLGFAVVITGLFIASMLCLVFALILFMADINLSLTALKLEVGRKHDRS